MEQSVLDLMIAHAVKGLASGDRRAIGGLVRDLALRWPNEKALMICFALTSASSHVEDISQNADPAGSPAFGYKLSALVAADILAIEALGRVPATGQDLLHFWRRVDPYFLNF